MKKKIIRIISALLFFPMLIMGSLFFYVGIKVMIPMELIESKAIIISKSLMYQSIEGEQIKFCSKLTYEYPTIEKSYSNTFNICSPTPKNLSDKLEKFNEGKSLKVFYDLYNPKSSMLVKNKQPEIGLGLIFILLGFAAIYPVVEIFIKIIKKK